MLPETLRTDLKQLFSNTYVTTGFTATASFVNGIKKTAPASVILQLQLSKDGGGPILITWLTGSCR